MKDKDSKIDQYLMGQMTGEELEAFEREIQADPGLAQEVETQKQAVQLLEISRDSKMKANLRAIHQSAIGSAKVVPIKRRKIFRFALGGVAAILLLYTFYFFFFNTPNPERLFSDHFAPYPISFSVRDANTDPKASEAAIAYKNGDYKTALGLFQVLESQSQNTAYSLGVGLCQLALNQPESAIIALQKLSNDPLFAEPAQWYTALAYLKLEDIKNCRNHLQTIEIGSEFYHRAKMLLEEI